MSSLEPVLYLVRVWHGAGAFRATARRVDQDTLHAAHSAQELAAYLADDGASAAAPGTAGPGTAPVDAAPDPTARA